MTVAELNSVYADILNELNKAVDRKEKNKVKTSLTELENQNTNNEGQDFEQVEFVLSETLKKIGEALKEAKPAKFALLAEIQGIVNGKITPFANRREVIKECAKDPDFIRNAEERKEENLDAIEGKTEEKKKMTTAFSAIGTRYVDEIKKNNTIIEEYDKLLEKEKMVNSLDLSIPGNSDLQSQILQGIKSIVSGLKTKGEDLSGYQLGKDNQTLINGKKVDRTSANTTITTNFNGDTTVEPVYKTRFFGTSISSAEELLTAYEKMGMAIGQLRTEISKLKADNVEIDNTIKGLENEALVQGIAYNDDGTLREEDDIVESVLEDEGRREQVESQYRRFGDKKDYFRKKMIRERMAGGMSQEEASKLKAGDKFKIWWNALWTSKKTLRREYALGMGIGMAETAKNARTARTEAFKQSISADMTKIDMTRDATDLEKDKAIKEAYRKAIRENEPGREPGED